MNMKTLIIAGALALMPALGMAASVEIFDNDSTTIGSGEDFVFILDVDTDGGAGDWMHTFNAENSGGGEASVTIGDITLSDFTDLTIAWLDGDDNEVGSVEVVNGDEEISTDFTNPDDLTRKLVITWTTSATTGFDGEGTISIVPLPAGVLLLGTALAGLGFARRRKAAV